MRPDSQRRAGGRLLQAPEPHPVARCRDTGAAWSSRASCSTTSTVSSGSTASGFRSTSPPPRAPPSAAWPAIIPAADGRCATAPCATIRCAMDAALADGTRLHFGEVPRDLAQVNSPDGGLAPVSRHARARRARGRGDRRQDSQKCSAGSAATISMRWCRATRRTTWRISWSARKGRWRSRRRSS